MPNLPKPPHVLLLGCGRSGTSIFGELFQQLRPYTYHSEPPFSRLTELDYSSPQAIKVPRESPGFPPTPGLSFPLEQLKNLFSSPHTSEPMPNTASPHTPKPYTLFWIVRHPLDTICSLRVGIGQNWGHHPRPLDWESWLDRPLLERCAHHWNFLNSLGYAQVEGLAHWCHFEAMIADPLGFARSVAARIGLDPVDHEPELRAWALRVQNTNNAHFVEAETSQAYSRPDHSVRVGRWQENLSAAEVERLVPLVKETAARFGYEL